MRRFLNVLFWSVIASAFVGPGTVTTAATSGARFGYALLWAMLFSTIATLMLQEASARVTVASNMPLGQAIQQQFQGSVRGLMVLILILGAIVFGCAAYEAGNILGGVSGAMMATGLPKPALTLTIGAIAGMILWFGSIRMVSYLMSFVVACMGFAFLVTAFMLKPDVPALLSGSFLPSFPHGSGLLILGLVGTTIVPYNFFLGSSLAKGQTVQDLRFGLTVSVLFGGIISMAVIVVGTAVEGEFSFQALSNTLTGALGPWGSPLFSIGLFSAGFSSAITAPLAAAVTAKSIFEQRSAKDWGERSVRYRAVWLGVLLFGVGFGLADIRPEPAIILAQALNGMILPFAAIFLLLVVNDRSVMTDQYVNQLFSNILMSLVVAVTVVLGVANILKAGYSTVGSAVTDEKSVLIVAIPVTVVIFFFVLRTMGRLRRTR